MLRTFITHYSRSDAQKQETSPGVIKPLKIMFLRGGVGGKDCFVRHAKKFPPPGAQFPYKEGGTLSIIETPGICTYGFNPKGPGGPAFTKTQRCPSARINFYCISQARPNVCLCLLYHFREGSRAVSVTVMKKLEIFLCSKLGTVSV